MSCESIVADMLRTASCCRGSAAR